MDDAQLDALIERIEVDEETGDVVIPDEVLEVSAVTSNQPLRVEIEPATLNCLTRTSFPTNSMPNG